MLLVGPCALAPGTSTAVVAGLDGVANEAAVAGRKPAVQDMVEVEILVHCLRIWHRYCSRAIVSLKQVMLLIETFTVLATAASAAPRLTGSKSECSVKTSENCFPKGAECA